MGIIQNILEKFNINTEEELATYKRISPIINTKNLKEENYLEENKHLVAVKPRCIEDIEKVVDALNNGECSILDLSMIKFKDMERIIDFLSGAVYALKADLQRLQGDMFVILPNSIKLNSLC